MKKIFLLLILFSGIYPCFKHGKISLSTNQVQAATFGSEDGEDLNNLQNSDLQNMITDILVNGVTSFDEGLSHYQFNIDGSIDVDNTTHYSSADLIANPSLVPDYIREMGELIQTEYAQTQNSGDITQWSGDLQVLANDLQGKVDVLTNAAPNNHDWYITVLSGGTTLQIQDMINNIIYFVTPVDALNWVHNMEIAAAAAVAATASDDTSTTTGQVNNFDLGGSNYEPPPPPDWTESVEDWWDNYNYSEINLPNKDCAGVVNGSAYRDSCHYCVGGTTGKQPCICPTDANFTVTKDMLQKINPLGNKNRMDSVLKYINLYKDDADFSINTRLRLAHFLAQITAETDGFTIMNEDYHYSRNALLAAYPKLFDTTNVDQYVNCLCVFDRMYCCQNGNGPESSQDGSKYRGHGIIQLTWEEEYQQFTTYYQNKYNDYTVNFVQNPELLATNMKYSVLAALWEVCKLKNLNKYADNDDVLSYSRGINIGNPLSKKTPKGLKKRTDNLKAAKSILCLNN